MIKDIVIIKDGMPLLCQNYSENPSIFSKSDNLIMLSGFFSAINSFSDQFDGMGSVSELKLSNESDLRLSFLRDPSLPNLVYMATFDENSKGVNVQRVLRRVSKTFLQKYNIESILKWRGRRDTFKAFEEVISEYVEEDKNETESGFKDKILSLFGNVEEKINKEKNSEVVEQVPRYYNTVPKKRISSGIDILHYTTGQNSPIIFNSIDNKKNIKQLSEELNIDAETVHNVCKNLLKMGFIEL